MAWMNRLISGAMIAVAKFAVISVLTYFGLTSDWFISLWLVFRNSPIWLQVSIWVILGAGVAAIGIAFLLRPISSANLDSLPRYFLFYKPIFRRISWRFERLFNCYKDYEGKFLVGNFPFHLRANWKQDLCPIYGVIRSRVSGRSIEISLAGPPPKGGYVPASTIDYCDAGVWVSGLAEFWPPILADDFMQEFGDLDFIFEYDRDKQFKRHFSKREVQKFLQAWKNFFEKQQLRSQPTIKIKASS